MHVGDRFVVGSLDLNEEHPARSRGEIQVGSVKQQVREHDDVALFGRDRHGAGQRKSFRINVVILLALLVGHAVIFQRSELVTSRVNGETAVLRCRVVQMQEHRQHGVLLVRKVRIVLVHQVRRSLLRWLDMRLRVMQHNVLGLHYVLKCVQQLRIRYQSGEHRTVHLQIMDGLDLEKLGKKKCNETSWFTDGFKIKRMVIL